MKKHTFLRSSLQDLEWPHLCSSHCHQWHGTKGPWRRGNLLELRYPNMIKYEGMNQRPSRWLFKGHSCCPFLLSWPPDCITTFGVGFRIFVCLHLLGLSQPLDLDDIEHITYIRIYIYRLGIGDKCRIRDYVWISYLEFTLQLGYSAQSWFWLVAYLCDGLRKIESWCGIGYSTSYATFNFRIWNC